MSLTPTLLSDLTEDLHTAAADMRAVAVAALSDRIEQVHNVNVANGWYETDRSVAADIALMHSEAAEMLEAYRADGLTDSTDDTRGIPDPVTGVLIPKPEGVPAELADVYIRLLDTIGRRDIDVAAVVGFYELAGQDAPVVSAGTPDADVEHVVALIHRRIDRMWDPIESGTPFTSAQTAAALLALLGEAATAWGVDLTEEYHRKISFNALRGHRHGGKNL